MFASLQTRLTFPTHLVSPAGPLPPGAQRLTVGTPDGERLQGVHIPARRRTKGPTTLILGFGGNAWNGQDVAAYLHDLYPEADVVAFHYRGYAPSSGKPSAEALIADAPLVFDAATKAVKPSRVVAVGFSIGSGIAASLPGRRELDGLILVTPFDSLKAVAEGHYPWLPIGAFFEHDVDSTALLRGSQVPVAIIAAADDTLIPPRRTDALRAKVSNLAFDRTIAGAGHNDLYGRDEFQSAMRDALATVSR